MKLLLIFSCAAIFVASASAQVTPPARAGGRSLTIAVLDENSVPVPGARVLLQGPTQLLRCETDLTGKCRFAALATGTWQLRVEKEGFYIFSLSAVQSSGTLEVAMSHQQEVRETVDVVESSPAIDPSRTSAQEQLSGLDIINIPYPNTRDYRYALTFIPGVILDQGAQPHLAGSETYETLVLLDGFNVTQPASGQLLVRVSTDALRTVTAETSRVPAEYGKGPAGVLDLETGIGDDHLRFATTNFVPSVQSKKGLALDKVDPRFTLSGPIEKGKIWFFDGLDGEYDNVIIPALPSNEDNNHIWRLGNLAKVQANITHRDIVTTSFLVNRLHNDHLNFSTLAPATTTPEDSESVYGVFIKDQHVFAGEKLLDVGFAFNRYGLSQVPPGAASYVLTPLGAQGNYYLHARTAARRWQALSNYYVARQWHGRHDLMLGTDADRLSYDQLFERAPILSLRQDGTRARYSTFLNSGPSTIYNTETSAYLQDRWSLLPKLLVEPGVRFDWDEIVRRTLFSPRLAGTYVPDSSGNTKFSAGIGVVYESTNLLLIAAPFAGSRLDTFYDPTGNASFSTVTTFDVNRGSLYAPRFVNWSVAVERKLPAQIFLKAEFIHRTGIHGFVYEIPPNAPGTNFSLQNTRNDQYHSFTVDARRTFRKRYVVTASYAYSTSRSNQVLDYSLDSLILGRQVAGPYPWDAPNRFISWGMFPLIKGFDAGYSLEARSGFPFTVINAQQQLVQPPGVYRFPRYFTLNFHLEKRFHALGFYWALRGGFDNITDHQNPYTVNNVLGSTQFLKFSNFDQRAFTARIRFLGRK